MNTQQSLTIALMAILLYPFMAIAAPTHDKTGSEKPGSEKLEEVIVTASPHQKSAQEMAGSFNLIAGHELQREAASTLGDTLQNQVGVSSSSFGPGVGNPVIRGLGGKRVEILQNSSSVGDASDVSPDHAVASEALLADRIEILRGPATLRFGPGAIGGVVNVIDNRIHTSPFEGIEGALETRYASNGDASAVVGRVDAGYQSINLHLDGVSRSNNNVDIPISNGGNQDFIANSDAEADQFSTSLSWVNEGMVLGFSYGELDNNYGLPPTSQDPQEPAVRIDMQQSSYQGKLLLTGLGNFFGQLDIDLGYTDYQHRELEFEDAEVHIGSVIDSTSRELKAELTHDDYRGWKGAWGLQFSNRDFGSSGDESYLPPSETQRQGFYWLEETALPLGNLELGARYDQQEVTVIDIVAAKPIKHQTINLGGSWIVPLADTQRLSLVVSHSERAPAAEELLSHGVHVATDSYEVGNSELQKESANNLEVTWVYEGGADSRWSARLSAYHNQFSRFIYLQDSGLGFSPSLEQAGLTGLDACSADIADFENSAEQLDAAVNCFDYQQRDASFSGVELETSWMLSDTQSVELQGDLVRGRFNNGSNRDIPRLPPATVRASWIYENDNWRGSISLTGAAAQTRAGLNQSTTAGYSRLDASLSYQLDNWSMFFKGQNLTDRTIRNATSFLRNVAPEAGRNLTVGVRYRF